MIEVRFKKLNEKAVMPKKAHATDAGFDLVATSMKASNSFITYGTGIALEIPEGYVGLLFPRSSICKKSQRLTNCVGVIDSGYRGEVMMKFKPDIVTANPLKLWFRVFSVFSGFFKKKLDFTYIQDKECYRVGERIGQLIIMPIPDIVLLESDELEDSERGTGGYGSSGK